MKKKYYAVKKGRVPGIYETWDQCKAQVHGQSGAIYKSFTSLEEARSFMGGEEETLESPYQAYVDGSFDSKTGVFGWGLVLLSPEGKEEFWGAEANDYSAYRNVAGEVYGSVKAVDLALARSYESISIFHDYTGIRHWALGEWKRNNPLTARYYDFMQEAQNHISINFIKVKAHSNHQYNDLADSLAKKAVKEYC